MSPPSCERFRLKKDPDLDVERRLSADVEVAVLADDLRIGEHGQLVGEARGGVGR